MDPVSRLSTNISAGVPVISAWCGIPDPSIGGVLASEDFDAVTFDMQHGAVEFECITRAIPLVAAQGKPSIVRVPVGHFATVSRLFDAGAAAVITPMVNTLEDAQNLVRFAKYPPIGQRSWGPWGAPGLTGMNDPEYFAAANRISLAIAQIESREGLAIVDQILTTPVDGIFVGPSDLSIALSNGEKVDPTGRETIEALQHCVRLARNAGKFAGVYAPTGERAAALLDMGFNYVALGSDEWLMRTGAKSFLASARVGLSQVPKVT